MNAPAGSAQLIARVRGPASDLCFSVQGSAFGVAVLKRTDASARPDEAAGADTVGTFSTVCTSDEAAAVLEAARRAAAAGSPAAGSPAASGDRSAASGDTGWSLDLDGRTVVVPHTFAVDSGLDAAVDPLIARALGSPVAAVRLEVHVVDVPGMGAMLGFTLASSGTEPTRLLLDPERFRVVLATGAAVSLAAPSLGLVDTDGSLRDGLRATAELPAGRRASCSFRLDAIPAGGGRDAATAGATPDPEIVSAGLSGRLELAGPWAAASPEPFTATARVLRVPAAPSP
ncbi:hypothetical protein ACWKWP_14070 [Agromyces soli]